MKVKTYGRKGENFSNHLALSTDLDEDKTSERIE